LRRRRAAGAGDRSRVAAIAVLAIAAAWWQFGRGGDAPSADTATIAVAPFRVGGAAADARYLREGLGDIIVAQLQTLPSTGAAGMRVMLDRWRRAGGGEDRDLDDAAASRAALDAGAGRLILGEIVGTGAALTVNARLLDAEQGGELARARVQGSADSLVVLASRIVTTLLSLDEGASSERLQAVLSARSEALTPFLTGEQLYRRGRYGEAGDAYVAAYEADTTFALAALRVYLANGWRIDSTVPGDWLDRAWRHRSRLSGTDSLLLIANAGETYPEPMPVRAALAAGERLARASNSAEIWYTYADDLFHIGLQVDEPNTLERALEGFTRAEALDSSFVPALEHQSQLYLALGDTANARRAHARQAAKDSLGDFFLVNDLMMSLTLGDDADRERAVSRAAARRPAILLYQAMLSTLRVAPGAALRIAVGDSAVARFERVDRGAVLPLSDRLRREFFWNRGQPAEAAARPAAPGQVSSDVEIVFAGLLWDADSAQARRAAERLQAYVDGRPADDYDSFYASAHFALAERAFARGDTAEVEARQAAIRRAGRAAPEPWLSETHAVYDEALGAQLAQARGAPDARERFERLDSLLVHAPNLSRRVARTTGNIVLAELWERAGEPERALRVARRQDWQFGFAMYYPDRLRRIARLARRLDRPEEEAEALQHFVEMRAQAEPHLQPEVAEARARLAVLRGGDR
jgi:TolB-like protein